MSVESSSDPARSGFYRLIDFGQGRKLEELNGYRIDRPSPAAIGTSRRLSRDWQQCHAKYDPKRREWFFQTPWPDRLQMDCDGFCMPVRPTPYGHIGLFPEQASNWQWIQQRGADLCQAVSVGAGVGQDDSVREAPLPVVGLNLFGYTGASSMAMVASGLAVAHVDAAKPNVQACREAAELNGWQDAPVRYLVDDALKFAQREVRRQKRYQMIVLDPPAYGHSPQGKAWRLERDLWPLLDACIELLDEHFAILVTGHSPEVDSGDVVGYLKPLLARRLPNVGASLQVESGRSSLESAAGLKLDTGFFARLWTLA